jgi:hypothetical protein
MSLKRQLLHSFQQGYSRAPKSAARSSKYCRQVNEVDPGVFNPNGETDSVVKEFQLGGKFVVSFVVILGMPMD